MSSTPLTPRGLDRYAERIKQRSARGQITLIRERFAKQSIDDIKQNTNLVLLAIKHHGDESKLNNDANDALQNTYKVIQLYISGNMSAYDTNKQLIR